MESSNDDSFFSNSSLATDADEAENVDPNVPEHRFNIKKHTTKTGKNKGQVRTLVTLTIPPYSFKKKRVNKGNTVTFSCNGCDKLDTPNYALAASVADDTGNEVFKLKSWPLKHACSPSSTDHIVRDFRSTLYAMVHKNPTRPVPSIFDEVREQITSKLTPEEKLAFLTEAPTFDEMKCNPWLLV